VAPMLVTHSVSQTDH